MLRLMLIIGAVLAIMCALLSMLALVISRALPGAGTIGFLGVPDRIPDIYLVDIDRVTLHNLSNNGTAMGGVAFSPDGHHIAFESNRDGNAEIYMLAVECHSLFTVCGEGIRQLTDHETDSHNPVWSPDSKQIAFVFDVSFSDRDNDIYVLDVESGTEHNLTNHMADDTMPAWSPDNRQIVFVSNRDGNYEIYMMSSDGSNPRRLTVSDNYDSNPMWSPDSSRISFVTLSVDTLEIQMIDSNGSNLQRLLSVTNATHISPAIWNPQGEHITFTSNEDGNGDMYSLNVNTGEIRQLTFNSADWSGNPAWSTNGEEIAFVTWQNPITEIYLMSATDYHVRPLTFNMQANYPIWWP